jgi:hypothetical protein
MRMRDYRTEIILAAIFIITVNFAFLINEANIHIRMNEMQLFMKQSYSDDNGSDQIMLLMRYKIQKQIYDNKKKASDIDEAELKATLAFKENPINTDNYNASYNPAYYLIKFIRQLTNRDTYDYNSYLLSQNNLQAAYYYERNYDFKKALNYFKNIKRNALQREEGAAIILHMGYCYAMLGDYANAHLNYSKVMNQYGDCHSATTAAILSQYLDGFRSEVSRVMKEKDSIKKGEQLFNLIAYKEALSVLERIDVFAKPFEKTRIDFYTARCFESTGESALALKMYFTLVKNHKDSEFARLANRRIFITGALKADGESLRKAAIANNTILGDTSFQTMVDAEKIIKDGSFDQNKAFHNDIESKLYENLFSEFVKNGKPDISAKNNVTFFDANQPKKKIYVRDGSIFIGIIIEDKESYLILLTIVGKVEIKKNQIIKMETINNE